MHVESEFDVGKYCPTVVRRRTLASRDDTHPNLITPAGDETISLYVVL